MRISDWSSDVCSSDLGIVKGFGATDIFPVGTDQSPAHAPAGQAAPVEEKALARHGVEGIKIGQPPFVLTGHQHPDIDMGCVRYIEQAEGIGARRATDAGDQQLIVAGSEIEDIRSQIGSASGRERVCPYGYD